jgi:cysteine desulfurase
LTGHPQKRLVSHVSFLVPDIPGDKMLNLLSSNKIYVSTGSACSAHSKTVSYVLKAIRIPEPDVFGSMRWTLSKYNTIEDIEYAVSIFKKIVEKLRSMA